MFGCYRKGDANDPDTYVAAITAVLSRYPEDVIKHVTHPAKGLPIRTDFLPTVAEVHRACEAIMTPRREATARSARVKKQLEERDELTPRTTFARDSAEARAVKMLHEIVGRMAAFFAIFRKGDGSVIYSKPMTPQLLALAKAPANEDWVVLTREQAAAWEDKMLRDLFEPGMVRVTLREGSRAPWPWAPGLDGRIYPTASGPPQMPD